MGLLQSLVWVAAIQAIVQSLKAILGHPTWLLQDMVMVSPDTLPILAFFPNPHKFIEREAVKSEITKWIKLAVLSIRPSTCQRSRVYSVAILWKLSKKLAKWDLKHVEIFSSSFSQLLPYKQVLIKMIDIILSYISAYISNVSSKRKILSFQDHTDSKFW